MAEKDKSDFKKTPGQPVDEIQNAGLYHSYPTETPNQFIHEYTTGRKILVEIDPGTGKEHFLKNL